MGIFDDFEYKEKCQNEEKVIEVLKKIEWLERHL